MRERENIQSKMIKEIFGDDGGEGIEYGNKTEENFVNEKPELLKGNEIEEGESNFDAVFDCLKQIPKKLHNRYPSLDKMRTEPNIYPFPKKKNIFNEKICLRKKVTPPIELTTLQRFEFFIRALNFANNISTNPKKHITMYKVYVGKGNNNSLIKSLLRNRSFNHFILFYSF